MKFYSSKGSLKKNQLFSDKSSRFYPDLISGIHRHRQFKQSPLIYIVVQWETYRPWTLFLDMLRCGKTFFIKNYIGGIRQAADDLSFDQVLLRFPKSNIDNVP